VGAVGAGPVETARGMVVNLDVDAGAEQTEYTFRDAALADEVAAQHGVAVTEH